AAGDGGLAPGTPAFRLRLVLVLVQLEHLGADLLVDAVAREVVCHAHGVLDGLCVRAAVADDASALHAQQRRAAVFRVIPPLLQATEGAPRQGRAGRAP